MTRRRRFARLLAPLALGTLLLASAGSSYAGWDDFEYGQKLIERGYTDYARRVFESILSDEKRTPADKERARFGMALLGKADAIRAMGDSRVPYAQVKEAFQKAVADLEAFLQKNPADPKADDAKMETGDLRLTFTQWGSDLARNDLVDDPTQDDPDKRIRETELRKTKPEEVREDMQRAVKSAGETFHALQTGGKSEQTKTLAAFRFVVSQYFQALAHPECSQPAIAALQSAEKILLDYSTDNEQFLTGAYAQDFLGLVYQQLGDCADGGDDKAKNYNEALSWFQAVSSLDDASDEHRKLIAKGYLHLGRLANAAKDLKAFVFVKAARRDYEQMDKRAPRVKKLEDGVLAYVEWALIEETLGDREKAIALCDQASNFAKEIGSRRGELRANDVLGRIVSASGGSGGVTSDPSIVQKVADDLFAKSRFLEAIAAYRSVIAAAPPTRQGLAQFAVPSWRRIGESYKSLKPPLLFEAAIAFDAIVDDVRSGRISNKVDTDPTAKVAYEAAGQQIDLLKQLLAITGDASVRDRMNARIEERAKMFETGSGGDQLYNLALQRFNQALDEKSKNTSGWQSGAAQAGQGFADVVKAGKSDYHDNALQYLVRVPLLLEKHVDAVAAADQALAWWETPEAKARIAGNEAAATRRAQQRSAVASWKATALRAMKKDAEALEIVTGFDKKYPGAAKDALERAKGLEVTILADSGRIEDAERELANLQRDYPDHYLLGPILLQIASHYRKSVNEIGARIDQLRWRLGGRTGEDGKFVPGLRQKLAELGKEEGKLSAAVGDTRALVRRAEDELKASGDVQDAAQREKMAKNAEETLRRQRPLLAKAQEDLKRVRAEREAAEKEAETVVAERRSVEKEQAAPLRKLAELYRRLDEIVKDLDAKEPPGGRKRRKSDFVYSVAVQYYQLARVEADVAQDWAVVRSLFEDYLAFPDVKAMADADDRKRYAMRALGDSYYRLAVAGATPEAQREAYETAVGYLQAGLAKVPQNTPIVVGHLSGETVVLSWQAKSPLLVEGTWRIPVPRAASVAEFRANVAALTPDRLPKYAASRTNENFQRILVQFKDYVADEAKISTAELERTVASLKVGGFDTVFFGEHAFVNPETLLALARAYARSGVKANAQRAFNMTMAVIYAAKVENDGPEWWEAKTIALEVALTEAEREVEASGDQSAKAKVAAKDVENTMAAMKRLYPHLGGPERHEQTLKEWKEMQVRLRGLMARLRLPTTPLDLEKEEPPEEAPPAPATPPEETPAMADDAGMADEPGMAGEPGMADVPAMDK